MAMRPSRTTARPSTHTSRARAGAQSTSPATRSQDPAWAIPPTSNTAKSARLPGSSAPRSSRPSTAAPPRVAISSASRALIASAPRATRCNSMAWRASPIRSPASLEAEPSTPSPTFTPASRIARTGAMPEPSRQLEHGQCATPVPERANRSISPASSFTQCACHTSGPVQPSPSAKSPGRCPNRSSEKAMSSSFSARWVCIITPLSRASSAESRISSGLTENGEHGATPTRIIAPGFGSWKASMTRMQSSRIAGSASHSASGGRPPALSPTLIEPRMACSRTPSARAASISSSSRAPLGNRYR